MPNPTGRWSGVSIGVAVALLLMAIDVLFSLPGLSTADRTLYGTDSYMRLVRIDELRSGAVGWFESWSLRSNAPFGHSMHWTRPLDALVLVVSLPVAMFTAWDDALYWAGVAIGPLLFAVLGLLIGWAARPLAGCLWPLASLAVVMQPAVLQYGAMGRLDHHLLVLVACAALFGAAIRLFTGGNRHTAMFAGLAAGVGLWVSTEFLLPLAIVLVAGAMVWAWIDSDIASTMVRFGVWLSIGTSAALVAERGPDLATTELDRLSWPHLLVVLLATLVWAALRNLRQSWAESPRGRTAAATAAGLAATGLLYFAVPGFLSGPFGDVPQELWDGWLRGVVELRPLWPLGDDPARSLVLLGGPALALAVAVWALIRGENRSAHALVALGLAALIGAGVNQLRFTAVAEVLAPIPLAWLAAQTLERVGSSDSVRASLGRVGALSAPFLGFLVPVLIASAIPAAGGVGNELSEPGCSARKIAQAVIDIDGTAPVVVANVDVGPEILYRTDATVVAAPYHRNVEGILDARRFFLSPSDQSRMVVLDRGVDVVVVCPGRDRNYLGSGADEEASTFAGLVDGRGPAWLEEVPFSGVGFRLFRVLDS